MGALRDERQVAAAERCIDALLAAGSTRLTVEQLHTMAGISKRSFHRYFPVKAQVIRPHYAAMTVAFSERIATGELTSQGAWVAAWSEVALGGQRDLELFRLIRGDPEYWAVFLEVVQDGEDAFARALRSPTMPGSAVAPTRADAEVAAVAIVAASRLALTAALEGCEPVSAFRDYLRRFGPSALRAD